MKVKTSALSGDALDWAVASIEWAAHDSDTNILMVTVGDDNGWVYNPTENWSQAGPIIEREEIHLLGPYEHHPKGLTGWGSHAKYRGKTNPGSALAVAHGPTPLVAAMRCFVLDKLGDTIDIPEELLQ
mgnify:CR=1 FL=1|jgi:hypothetical protein